MISKMMKKKSPPALPSAEDISRHPAVANNGPPFTSLGGNLPSGPPPVPQRPDVGPLNPPSSSAPGAATSPGAARGTEPDSLPYYHAHIQGMEETYKLMEPHLDTPGSFILRNSQGTKNTYTVTAMHRTGLKHFKIQRKENQYYIVREKCFDTIADLIKYYGVTAVPNLDNVGCLYLIKPLLCPSDARICPSSRQTRNSQPSRAELGGQSSGSNHQGQADRAERQGRQAHPTGVHIQGTQSVRLPGGESTCKLTPEELYQIHGSYITPGPPVTGKEPNVYLEMVSDGDPVKSPADRNYYSLVSENANRFDPLLEHLRRTDSMQNDRCECGLLLEESQLPIGWSFHISREAETNGRVFFLAPDGTTSWTLPLEICVILEPQQQDHLRDLLRASDNFLSASQWKSEGQQRQSNGLHNYPQNQNQLRDSQNQQKYQQPSNGLQHDQQKNQSRSFQSQQKFEGSTSPLVYLTRTDTIDNPEHAIQRSGRRSDSNDDEEGDTYGIVDMNQISGSVLRSKTENNTHLSDSLKELSHNVIPSWANSDAAYLKYLPLARSRRNDHSERKIVRECRQPTDIFPIHVSQIPPASPGSSPNGGTSFQTHTTRDGNRGPSSPGVRRSNTLDCQIQGTNERTTPLVPARRSRTLLECTSRIREENHYMPMTKNVESTPL